MSGAVAIALVAIATAQNRVPSGDPGLTVPPGFEVEQVAGPPLVTRPIVADFDDEGRLYVADSSGSNDKVEKQLADRPHRIVRLEDVNGDGTYDTSVVFADRMMLPEGTMWFDGSLYVAAPPSIWRLTDTDDDGVADQREEWFKGATLTGCANDLHGPYAGPDGWIYWTKGAFAQQTYDRGGKPSLVTRAAHIFRRRPGDQAIDVVMTGGMDNPVDVAFTPAGERILTATFVEHPQGGRRDGLLHAVYGGVYGKPHGVVDGHPRTGDLMPVMCQLGPAVPAGLTRYGSDVFGAGYRDSFFAAMFNLRKVTRHVLEPSGATFTTRDSDFLVSERRDFHPTDVIEDADGSLLVIDTGPWYKLCCPTSQLAKPDVPGAIYRVRRLGAPGPADPRGRALSWNAMTPSEMASRLDDPRPAVQRRLLGQFSKAGESAVPPLSTVLSTSSSVEARRNAVWALTRIDGALARGAVRAALADRDESVRQAAMHSVALLRDRMAVTQLVATLRAGRPALARAAAEALGRIGDTRAIPAILTAVAAPADRVLEHSLTYALMEIGEPSPIAAALEAGMPSRARRAALIALDQIGTGHLTPEALVPLFDSTDATLVETAWWIAAGRPEWGRALAGFFEKQLATVGTTAAEREALSRKLAQFASDPTVQTILASAVSDGSPSARSTALAAMSVASSSSVPAAARLKELPPLWTTSLARVLRTADGPLIRQIALVVRATPGGKVAADLEAALLSIARDAARPLETRLDTLGVIQSSAPIDQTLFDLLRAGLAPSSPGGARGAAASIVANARFDRHQLMALVTSLETARPLDLPRILQAFDGGAGQGAAAPDEELGMAIVLTLGRSSARSAIRADILRQRLERYPDSVKEAGEVLLASIHEDSRAQAARLSALLATTQGGDIARGQAVFNSTKGACLSCHAIGYIGGRIGPDLTRIGQVRSERDLVEAIVFPSVSFARGYEPVVVRTRSGDERGGSLVSDADGEVVLSDVAGNEVRIPRAEVADMQPGTVSLMPSGFADVLTSQELADLVAFLKAAR